MKQVIVGITGNIKEMPAMSGMHFDAVSRHLSDGVKVAGGVPIIIPVGTPDLAKTYISMIDKLVLSGGQNVTPEFYGEEKEVDSDDYSLERDEFEFALVKEAIRQNKPILQSAVVCNCLMLLWVALSIKRLIIIGKMIFQEHLMKWKFCRIVVSAIW